MKRDFWQRKVGGQKYFKNFAKIEAWQKQSIIG
jgi:hypothetical protein